MSIQNGMYKRVLYLYCTNIIQNGMYKSTVSLLTKNTFPYKSATYNLYASPIKSANGNYDAQVQNVKTIYLSLNLLGNKYCRKKTFLSWDTIDKHTHMQIYKHI